jgi:hypothetical protein
MFCQFYQRLMAIPDQFVMYLETVKDLDGHLMKDLDEIQYYGFM